MEPEAQVVSVLLQSRLWSWNGIVAHSVRAESPPHYTQPLTGTTLRVGHHSQADGEENANFIDNTVGDTEVIEGESVSTTGTFT